MNINPGEGGDRECLVWGACQGAWLSVERLARLAQVYTSQLRRECARNWTGPKLARRETGGAPSVANMTPANHHNAARFKGAGRSNVLFLAIAAGVATSTSYLVQPELSRIAIDLGASLSLTSAAAGLPILGYMVGLALLVPLVDRFPARRLVSVQLTVLSLSLALAAIATSVYAFGAALLVSGICASTGAQMTTLASKYASAERRGRALGTVTAGISAGVLLGRTIGGGLADGVGWRAMLVIMACGCLICAAGSRALLSGQAQRRDLPYLAMLFAMPRLLRNYPELTVAAVSGSPLGPCANVRLLCGNGRGVYPRSHASISASVRDRKRRCPYQRECAGSVCFFSS